MVLEKKENQVRAEVEQILNYLTSIGTFKRNL